ncbi:DUF4384 domain-containing protein [Sorangium sp. So ce429]
MSISAAQRNEERAEPGSASVDESSESTSTSGFRRLHWELVIAIDLSSGAEETLPSKVTESFVVAAGTMIAVQGNSDQNAYVYLAVIAEHSRVVHVYPENGEAVWVEAGVATRIPSEKGWFTVPADGKVRVVSALRPLSREEIAEELDGREPQVKVSTLDTR